MIILNNNRCKFDKTINNDIQWSILDEKKGARSIEDSIKTLINEKLKNKQGYKYFLLLKTYHFIAM